MAQGNLEYYREMCTIIVWQNCWPTVPLLLATNRDEHLSRDWISPLVQEGANRKFVAPKDLQAGGTWLGINDAGVFVGITNRFGALGQPDRITRGRLVTLALEGGSAKECIEQILTIEPFSFNPFHLVVADRSTGFVLRSDGQTFHTEVLRKGVSIITERSFSSAESMREEGLEVKLAEMSELGSPPEDEFLEELLRQHDEVGFDGVCVHVPDMEYGTRSSAIIRFSERRGEVEFKWANGPPCETPFQDFALPWSERY